MYLNYIVPYVLLVLLHTLQLFDKFPPNHWFVHHVFVFASCLLYPKERQQFWADQLGVRFLPLFNYGHKHHTKVYTKTLSILISIQIWRITSKLAILFSTQQCGKMIFNKWTFIVDPQWYFCAQKYQTAFSVMNFTSSKYDLAAIVVSQHFVVILHV